MNCESLIQEVLGRFGRPNAQFMSRQDNLTQLWKAWYNGYVKEFHQYWVTVGDGKQIQHEKLQLGMAKKCCEDFANLLLNEKCEIVVPESSQELLNTILDNNHFKTKANSLIEKMMALGNGAFVENVCDLKIDPTTHKVISTKDAKIVISTVDGEKMYPITYENGNITEIAFAVQNTNTILIQTHLIDNRERTPEGAYNPNYGNYVIVNAEYEATALNSGTAGKMLNYYEFQTGSNIPWFQCIKPSVVNNLDIDSPLGISIFGNAVNTLKAIDNGYDSLNNEIELGRKRIIASTKLTKINADGQEIDKFDTRDQVFYQVDSEDVDKNNLFQEVNGELRVDAIVNEINFQLNMFSAKVGLGNAFYRFDANLGLQTATAVMSQNSDTFRSIRKHEILLRDALKNLTKAVTYICNTFTKDNLGEIKDDEIDILFDDSIIEDTEAQKTSDRQDLANGTMSKVEYRMKWYGEDEETATKELMKFTTTGIETKINALLMPLNQKVMTPAMFVDLVYGDTLEETPKKELIDYISDRLNNGGMKAEELDDFPF